MTVKVARIRAVSYVLLYVQPKAHPNELKLAELDTALRPLYAGVQLGPTKLRRASDRWVVVRLFEKADEKEVTTKLAELGYKFKAREVKPGILMQPPRRIPVTKKRPRDVS